MAPPLDTAAVTRPPPVTHDDLREAEDARRRALDAVAEATATRDALVRRAVAEGQKHSAIAEALDCSRGRVGQILHADG